MIRMDITGIGLWIWGIIVAILGFAIPLAIIQEHPRKWKKEALVVSSTCFAIGIGIVVYSEVLLSK